MHPALQLESLDYLPAIQVARKFSFDYIWSRAENHAQSRRIKAIAAPRNSTEWLQRIVAIMRDEPDTSQSQRDAILYLPIFYANIDPAAIPSGAELEIPSTFTEGAVHRALLSLRSMYFMTSLPSSAFRDLWPSAWKWIQFFDTYSEHIRVADGHVDQITGGDFILFTVDHKQCYDLLSETPGFRRMLARAWRTLLRTDDFFTVSIGFDTLTLMLFTRVPCTLPAHTAEVIDGAGGTLSDLACLVVGYLDIAADGTLGGMRRDSHLLGGIFDFVEAIDRSVSAGERDAHILGPFSRALLVAGIIKSLTSLACVLIPPQSVSAEFPPLLERSLNFLNRTLPKTADHESVSDALECGLLHVIISCGAAGEFHDTLTSLLQDTLPPYLIHVPILSILHGELPGLYVKAKVLPKSAIYQPWEQFIALAEERLLKACDNLECGKIGPTSLFKRCANCRAFYYCSQECQKADWSNGEHFKFCAPHGSCRLSQAQPFGVRQRSFMRALLNHDYHAAKYSQIYPQQARFMARSSAAFLTLFDYTRGRVHIEVQPVLRCAWLKYFGTDSGWYEDVLRVARADGRVELHVMALPEGTATRYCIVPLRTETDRIDRVLRSVGSVIDSSTPASD
ncbi:hypothetical protein DFH06DRAFT_1314243 [Mycena polygramma]|nr:hypothetical protein DFH06DRAFT_1314243 [Mycena polygramma]